MVLQLTNIIARRKCSLSDIYIKINDIILILLSLWYFILQQTSIDTDILYGYVHFPFMFTGPKK